MESFPWYKDVKVVVHVVPCGTGIDDLLAKLKKKLSTSFVLKNLVAKCFRI
jgi:hypothetical protein